MHLFSLSRMRHFPVLLQLERSWLRLEMAPSGQAQSHRLLAIVSCNHLEWLLPLWHQCFLGSWAQLSFRLRHLWAWSLSHQAQHHLRHSGLPALRLLALHPRPAAVSMAFCLGMLCEDVGSAGGDFPKAPLCPPEGVPWSSQGIRTSLTATF